MLPWRKAGLALIVALAAALPADAGQVRSTFLVTVVLHTIEPTTGLCKVRNLQGIEVAVVCTENGRPLPSPRYHLSFAVWKEGQMGNVDVTAGAGTVTSWRIVRLANREYLEMTVGW